MPDKLSRQNVVGIVYCYLRKNLQEDPHTAITNPNFIYAFGAEVKLMNSDIILETSYYTEFLHEVSNRLREIKMHTINVLICRRKCVNG